MNIEIVKGPGNAAAKITLDGDERVTAEGGAMIAAGAGVDIETTTRAKGKGGLLSGFKRMLGGESFFLNHFTAPADGGEVWLAAALSGDMCVIDVPECGLAVEGGGFVACEQPVEMDVGWQGFKSLFSGEGLFWLKVDGSGRIVINSFGGIYTVDVDGEYIVDTGHIVAFENSLSFRVSKAAGSWMTAFLGGEGLVSRFSGKGRIWCQSHNPSGFGSLLGPKLKPRES